jgi:tRNA/tmRNA/rRNA uracil-C5-methylase (TrmA/RlmC/RlmD family)
VLVEAHGSAREQSKELRAPDLVIANPPRKGLGAEVCAALRQLRAAELRIMSCGPQALARDLQALAGAYQLVELRAFDTLPQTPHVELVASLLPAATRPSQVACATQNERS